MGALRPHFVFKDHGGDREYVFDRIAECDAEGCSLDQLKKNEVLIRPGLIYRPA